MGIVTRKDEVTKLRVFTGVVVESIERINTFTNAEQWAWVIYNRDTGTFAMPDAVNNIEPTSRGYDNSGIKKRLDALNAVGFDEYNPEADTWTEKSKTPESRVSRLSSGPTRPRLTVRYSPRCCRLKELVKYPQRS